MRILVALALIAAGLSTIYSGILGVYNVGLWLNKVAELSTYTDPHWWWVITTMLYVLGFAIAGGVSLTVGVGKIRRR